ncbi:coiled-coil domain-containing protein [Natronoglycomyces albus]|uniref:ARB-07466-like C-terminal domain-containing protein n=1 Tax=Natronoglycomyces albus TaxID=2811108 RepID=A0A895XKC3_9ACTN|nr:hypothetical protein [Natronoglycomyces albus]QSB04262.1 hypothetical protein JQS30_10660 [Natronoglycomyces albus]
MTEAGNNRNRSLSGASPEPRHNAASEVRRASGQGLRKLPVIALAALLLVTTPIGNAVADPPGDDSASSELSSAIEDFLNAEDELAALKQEEKDLERELEDSREMVEELEAELGEFAALIFTTSDLHSTSALLSSENPEDMIHALTTLDFLGDSRARRIDELTEALADFEARQEALDDIIAEQADILIQMEDARNAAARELAASGGDAAQGPSPGDFRRADPVPRNPDGSLPYESCSMNDPTTNGCLTPRTLHALEQATIAGFGRYTACFRHEASGEHPQGRACDFSASPNNFGGHAYGDDKAYGDNLAAWFVENSNELGVQYVIWYRQIWFPSSGWRHYNLAYGDPNTDHTNHVHVSIR